MKKTIFICDRCGYESDLNWGFSDIEVIIDGKYQEYLDLCEDCLFMAVGLSETICHMKSDDFDKLMGKKK